MRVCIFADFPIGALSGEPAGRGAGQLSTWFPQLARSFEAFRDVEIHWCVLVKHLRRPATEIHFHQVFHLRPGGRITTGLLAGRWLPRRTFRGVIREVRPDLIHCWGTETLNSAALWEFAGPSILSMQGILTVYWRAGGFSGWRLNRMKNWEPPALRRAGVVTSESQWGLDRIRDIAGGVPVRRIEYGVAPGFYEVGWNPDPAAPRILFAGTLNRTKGFDILLDMLARHRTLPWTLVVAGDGPFGSRLREMRHPSVEQLGMVTSQRLQAEMSRAWALVLPSRADTSPNVVKEARVVGLPVVVSPHGGHAGYVEDGVDGRIVGTGDPDDWFAALDGLGRDLDTVRGMGRARHAFYRDYFRPERTASEFVRLYRDMVKG